MRDIAKVSWVALGGNQSSIAGGPAETVAYAIDLLKAQGYNLHAKSRLFANPAFPLGSGPDYVNAVVGFQTDCAPHETLEVLHEIEAKLGRERHVRWGSRSVDLDLIAVGDAVFPDVQRQNHWRNLPLDDQMIQTPDELILPHPRMQDRAFVLVPMAEIAPNWLHPILEKTVLQMLNDLPQQDKDDVRPIE
ncbi:2-amino-4-hydroxy-6-hydroxymethyldihydropteridine diphosphokinase [Sulfitobacter marinus]|uniref:2-amino-4-hydroxy-6- hydroxymethyldihydropteridine diphosphokinase n=1 Tax=Sulfitobacter marinus TaxID=394264 RepID=UPI001FE4239F|nr:2-amino-4-hydroxy-6-hydroxymethyldihydropteridine diphosphokinase [Sulfitobacter marinus]